MCENDENYDEIVVSLKNDPEFMQQLRGEIPDVNLEEAKQRLFQRIFMSDQNGRSNPEE